MVTATIAVLAWTLVALASMEQVQSQKLVGKLKPLKPEKPESAESVRSYVGQLNRGRGKVEDAPMGMLKSMFTTDFSDDLELQSRSRRWDKYEENVEIATPIGAMMSSAAKELMKRESENTLEIEADEESAYYFNATSGEIYAIPKEIVDRREEDNGRELASVTSCASTDWATVAQLDKSRGITSYRHFVGSVCDYIYNGPTGSATLGVYGPQRNRPSGGWSSARSTTIVCCPSSSNGFIGTYLGVDGYISGGVVAHDTRTSSGYRKLSGMSQGAPLDMFIEGSYYVTARRMSYAGTSPLTTPLATFRASGTPVSTGSGCALAEAGEYSTSQIVGYSEVCAIDQCYDRRKLDLSETPEDDGRRLDLSVTPGGALAVCAISATITTITNVISNAIEVQTCDENISGALSNIVTFTCLAGDAISLFTESSVLDFAVSNACSLMATILFSIFTDTPSQSRFLYLDDY